MCTEPIEAEQKPLLYKGARERLLDVDVILHGRINGVHAVLSFCCWN